jgi:2-polyprenyl-3-methyl-5-hydroxy-6-metoxy-1,4-benzoquinol methylase
MQKKSVSTRLKRLFGIEPPSDDPRATLLRSLVDAKSQPRLDAMTMATRDIELTHLTIKAFGYDLARRLKDALPLPEPGVARVMNLGTKLSTQADIESDWTAHWCAELQIPVVYHRKVWELAYVLQAIHDGGHIRAGARGLGFGCGIEVIPSYLAAHGAEVTVTDLPPAEAEAKGWAATDQHALSLASAFHPHLVDRETFDRLVSLRYLDMTAIPADLQNYDFCWSVCALEHLGSIQNGLDFIENSLRTLRPGGVAVHTTEFNIRSDVPTIDNWPTVLFQRQHFEALAARLAAAGHTVAPLDFTLGEGPMDRFIDVPPWAHDLPANLADWLGQPYHLKLSVDGFPCTCVGIVIRKAES